MAGLVTKPGRDAEGNPIDLLFYQNDDGSLQPVQMAQGANGEALATQPTLEQLLSVAEARASQATAEAILAAVEAQAKGTSEDPTTAVLSGSNTVEPQSGTTDATITFASAVAAVQVYNDSGNTMTVTVNGDAHTIPDAQAYEIRRADAPFAQAQVTATGQWYAVGLR